jgi:Short C-terminal domain
VAGADRTDPTEELRNLAELHKQGILTDEEFAAKKKQILGI